MNYERHVATLEQTIIIISRQLKELELNYLHILLVGTPNKLTHIRQWTPSPTPTAFFPTEYSPSNLSPTTPSFIFLLPTPSDLSLPTPSFHLPLPPPPSDSQ
ncbi:hypothetical protein EQH57_0826 [Dictyocoela roeselum]|nr:hypothetical protein EQH57_0826 [Dictyocoela roeselum]